MIREFIYTQKFDKEWHAIGLGDYERRLLELNLLENPDTGEIMTGTGGIRKMRWPLRTMGKSGGIRVLYIDFVSMGKICMFDVFAKNEKENLSHLERNILKQLVKAIKEEFSNE